MSTAFFRPFRADPYCGDSDPRVETIWVVVPLSRPHMLSRVRENFERQIFPGKKIVIVENGDATGACKSAGFEPDILVTSEPSPGAARNAALKALRDIPGSYFVNMDDDDWYGEHYLSEHAGLARRGRLVGNLPHWVHFEGRSLGLFRPWAANQRGAWVRGGTAGAYVREAPLYPDVPEGEDVLFCARWIQQGGYVWLSSIYHSAYVRRLDVQSHAFAAPDRQFVRHMGGACGLFPESSWDLVRGLHPIGDPPLGELSAQNWPYKRSV